LPVVLYGCETWSLSLREERRLRVFENRILGEYLDPRQMRMGEWRLLHNDFIVCTVHLTLSKRLRWASHVTSVDEGRSAFKMLTGKPTGKRTLGRPRRTWEDNIRLYL
jgi:hypothetical protein